MARLERWISVGYANSATGRIGNNGALSFFYRCTVCGPMPRTESSGFCLVRRVESMDSKRKNMVLLCALLCQK